MTDTYKTIQGIGEGIYTEKRSKFLAFSYHVQSLEAAKALIDECRKKFYDARHVCYAYVIGTEKDVFRANDDGEPSSTAGKPILGQINSNDLTNVLVIVVRYYGGINLGTGGLIVAYRTAAAEAIRASQIVEKTIEETVSYSFQYTLINRVMRVVKDLNARVLEQNYGETCDIKLSVKRSLAPLLREKLKKLPF